MQNFKRIIKTELLLKQTAIHPWPLLSASNLLSQSPSPSRRSPEFILLKSAASDGKDPEGVLGAPKGDHISRLEFKRRLDKDADAREAFERQVREEKDRMRALRENRVAPDTEEKLVEYFLDTEAQEIEFEIARLRPRLNEEFFSHLKLELGKLRFAVSKTQDVEDRIFELETLSKALQEGIEAYDRMQSELVTARSSLMKLFTSKDVKATLLDMVESNELNRSLLTLLDENIATAYQGNQTQAAQYMEKIRGAMLKYLTV